MTEAILLEKEIDEDILTDINIFRRNFDISKYFTKSKFPSKLSTLFNYFKNYHSSSFPLTLTIPEVQQSLKSSQSLCILFNEAVTATTLKQTSSSDLSYLIIIIILEPNDLFFW